jgi:Putative phage tail protein
VPSLTLYYGTHDITVPVDIRAQYDRTFPVYGYAGACYMVFRLINSTVFNSFNVNATVNGRLCRQYDSSGFIVNSISAEAVGTGDGSTVRFKLANWDIAAVSSLTVGGTSYTQMDASHQTGNVFHLNATKGYVEFPTAPPGSAAIIADYTCYSRAWSNCPADHLVYLLTEPVNGKGLDGSRIDWPRAVAFQTYCNATITWTDSNGTSSGARFTSNYAIDFRKPINEHIQAVMDASCGYLFLSGGKFVMKARAADSSVFSFNETNILQDSFSSELTDRTDKPNRLKLFYHDQSTYNSETEVDMDDAVDQASRAPFLGNDGVVEATLKLPAVDNQPQSEQIGATMLYESVYSRWTVALKTTVLGLALEPGDIVDVTHSSQPAWSQKLFRIEDLQYGDDDRLELQLSEFFTAAYF